MKKTILITLALTSAMLFSISNIAQAGMFDSKEQKMINNLLECSKTVKNTDDMSCASDVISSFENLKQANGKIKKDSFELPKGMTEKQFQGHVMLVAMADMCFKNPKTNEKKTLANLTEGDFACGMIKNIKGAK